MVESYYKKEVGNEGKETKIKENKGVHNSVQDSADMDCTSRMKLDKVNIEDDNSDNSDETIVLEKDKKKTCFNSSKNNEFDNKKSEHSNQRKKKQQLYLQKPKKL
ncbi:hypothetical protein F8M41_001955 [Gigaspora margarita]|uniref:Uncharacterized protein n=1 Tax=Gigaspora margarita TaxID=4874 RepID=A0A8H3XDL9_GIGMA|nr:hypothetical protein F8M41_001955 [Gigaspora margarita]